MKPSTEEAWPKEEQKVIAPKKTVEAKPTDDYSQLNLEEKLLG